MNSQLNENDAAYQEEVGVRQEILRSGRFYISTSTKISEECPALFNTNKDIAMERFKLLNDQADF